MSELRFEDHYMQGEKLFAASELPALRNALIHKITANVDETDDLLIGYGLVPNIMPHTMQDHYSTEMKKLCFASVILENEFLKARFIPSLGGRLWSLYDKQAKQDLILENTTFKLGNFAVRNAWVVGGVEWNIGSRGHDAYTCSPLFSAVARDTDGSPVLRMYEFSRVRAVVYQMDFFLPANSRFLFARMRIMNPNQHIVPMYWWSNIAVRECEKQRIIVPATTTFANTYISDTQHSLCKVPLPVCEGFDCTYPVNHWNSKDHFFNIPAGERKFVASIYQDGYGLIHASTDLLKGRKLFVWGQSPGGKHWQKRLLSEGVPDYAEIQAGLCHTQLEHIPMPAGAAWEWLEAYGAVYSDPKKIFGQWNTAVAEVTRLLTTALPREKLDSLLRRTGASFALQKAELISNGSGWGALENLRRLADGQEPLPGHLEFGEVTEEQSEWVYLLRHGRFPRKKQGDAPRSYMVQQDWVSRSRKATEEDAANWYSWFHLGLNYYYRNDFSKARDCIEKALLLEPNVWSEYALANICRSSEKIQDAALIFAKIVEKCPADFRLVKDAFKTMLEAKDYPLLIRMYEILPAGTRAVPLIRFLYIDALARAGNPEKAESLLNEFSQQEITDLREGENSLSELYIFIRRELAGKMGRKLEVENIEIPFCFDLRMNSKVN